MAFNNKYVFGQVSTINVPFYFQVSCEVAHNKLTANDLQRSFRVSELAANRSRWSI